jgi:hypothetical protein
MMMKMSRTPSANKPTGGEIERDQAESNSSRRSEPFVFAICSSPRAGPNRIVPTREPATAHMICVEPELFAMSFDLEGTR